MAERQLGRYGMAQQEVSIHNVHKCISHCFNNREASNQDGHVENVLLTQHPSYNSYMGGVDTADQLCGYYHVWMKSQTFRLELAQGLIGNYNSRQC